MSSLHHYYVRTDEYDQLMKHGARLAVGRKGSGKTALFFQVRDRLRQDRKCLVIDLKPQGHQLKRLKHVVLHSLEESVQEHMATAFWQYMLYLEICYKILERDRDVQRRDPRRYDLYQQLAGIYRGDVLLGEADFSERMLILVNKISDTFAEKYTDKQARYLTSGEVTGLIYQHDLPDLRNRVTVYLEDLGRVVLLFDNIDKGWPTRGLTSSDVLLLRGLLDATRKLEGDFARRGIELRATVFLRNDVYEFLVDQSPDRGKESKVSLDWTDPDLMKEFIRKRLAYNDVGRQEGFDAGWNRICVSHVSGEPSFEYLLGRSLMRPRNLLNLVNHCKTVAVNLRHGRIMEEDIRKACGTYSSDLASDIGLEIRDVFPNCEDVIYSFIGAQSPLTLHRVAELLDAAGFRGVDLPKVVELLLWFAFLGVSRARGEECEEIYIYQTYYDLKKLRRLAGDLKDNEASFCIHRAFWPFLEIC